MNERYLRRNVVGGLDKLYTSFLWSSSQERTSGTGMAWGQVFYEPDWYQGFESGDQFANFKSDEYPVRPIRAF